MNEQLMNVPFEEDWKLLECECDFRGEILPGGLLRLSQQMGTDHCTAIGMDDAFYRETKSVFLLAKQAYRINRAPRRGELLRLRTMGENAKRAVYKRITEVMDAEGNVLAVVDSRWVLVNTESWRIYRRPPEGYPLTWTETVPVELEQTIRTAEELTEVGMVRADYSLCDTNSHINNTRYADIACNALPLEVLQGSRVKELRINYHREVPMGESFTLYRGQTEENVWYVSAQREDKMVFEARIELENCAEAGR